MATKSDKYSFFEQNFSTSENGNYLNLNQSKKCPILLPVQSNSKPNNDKYRESDNYEEKEKLQSWDKSSKMSIFTTLKEDNVDLKKGWKNENTLKTTNKSTLSLHIAAYENSIEANASNLFGVKNIEGLKKEKFGSIKTSKRCFTNSFKSQNPFEFPRQQDGDERNKPEVMQFQASQQLLDSSRPSSSQQNGHNDGHIVRPQVPPRAGTAVSTAHDLNVNEVTGNLNILEVHADVCTKCQKPLEGVNDGISCTRNPCEDVGEQIQDLVINSHINVHKLCAECVVNAAAFVLARNEYIIGNGIGLECVDQTCRRLFLISQMHQFLPPELEEQLQDKVIQKSMEAFCHENPNHHIFKCAFCNHEDLIDESARFHKCKECAKFQCWVCGRLATKAHEIRSCEEMAQAELNPSRGFLKYNCQPLKPRFV